MAETIWSGVVTVSDFIMDNLFIINIFLSLIIVFFQRRSPQTVWTWLLLMYFIPILGFVLYLVIGQDFHKSRMFKAKEIEGELKYAVRRQEETIYHKRLRLANPEMNRFKDLILYNLEAGEAVLTDNNDIRIYTDGKAKFRALIDEMKQAQKYIHLQYYIIRNDELWQEIEKVLIQKAREGVQVRVLFDSMGCRTMHNKDWKRLEAEGIMVAEFFPALLGKLQLRVNYRNHRKILVVDGVTGFLGGVNIADRYYYGTNEGDWHDTHIKITGESVFSLQACFMMDRHFALNRRFRFKRKYYPELKLTEGNSSLTNTKIYSQVISSGPDSDWASIMQCYFSAITSAKEHIYIVSPYFTPCESILNAIKIAALSEIDVRIMLPEKSDTELVQYGTMSFVGELLEAGVKIYLFKNGFNHSKVISIDGEMSIVGSANMDVRSFEGYEAEEQIILACDDLKAENNAAGEKVFPIQKACGKIEEGYLTTVLGKASWNVIRFKKH